MRRKDREVTELSEILKIVASAKVLRIGLFDGEYPYVVPMHYGYQYAKDTLVFYVHCAKEGHKLDLMKKNPHVCVELETEVEIVSGGDVPCRYGATFASVIGRGQAEILEDVQEKITGLEVLMKHQTGRDFEIKEEMAESVAVIKITLDNFTAKRRTAN